MRSYLSPGGAFSFTGSVILFCPVKSIYFCLSLSTIFVDLFSSLALSNAAVPNALALSTIGPPFISGGAPGERGRVTFGNSPVSPAPAIAAVSVPLSVAIASVLKFCHFYSNNLKFFCLNLLL